MSELGRSTIALTLGGLLLALAAVLVTSFGSLSELTRDGQAVFQSPFASDRQLFDLAPGTNVKQDISVTVDEGIAVTITAKGLSTELRRAVAEGEFVDSPELLAETYLARLELEGAPAAARMRWSAPVLIAPRSGAQEVQITGTIIDLPSRPNGIRIYLSCFECPAQLEVRSTGINLVGVNPNIAGTVRSARTLLMNVTPQSLPFRELTVYLEPKPTPRAPTKVEVPDNAKRWWFGFARSAWPLVIWFFLWPMLIRTSELRRTDNMLDEGMLRAKQFTLLGVIAAIATCLWLVDEVLRALAPNSNSSNSSTTHAALYQLNFADTVPAVSSLFLVWALAVRSSTRVRRHVAILGTVAVLAAGAALAQVIDMVAFGAVPPWWSAGVLTAGLVAALAGSALVANATGQGVLAISMAGAGALVLISTLSSTYATASWWGAGVLTLLCGAFMLTTMLLLAADLVGYRRASGSLRAAALLLVVMGATAAAYPSYTYAENLSSVSAYDAVATSSVVTSVLPLVLTLLSAVLLIRTLRDSEPPRLLLVGLTAVLLLRPEAQYLGIPWGFLVGVLLIPRVLLPVGAPLLPAHGPPVHKIRERVRARVHATAAARTTRERHEALRRKVASAELDVADAADLQKTVDAALGEATSSPRQDYNQPALAWSAWPDPRRRGLLAMTAATIVGVLLGFSYLLESLGRVEGVAGARNAFAVMDVIAAFKFPWYGLAFGCLLPLIPGTTGLLKAFRLFTVIAASEVLVIAVPWGSEQTTEAVLLRLLQIAVMCVVLGLLADLAALHEAGLSATSLGDLYATNRVVLWSSGIAVAVATTTATALLGSATSLLIERIVPPPATPLPPVPGPQSPGPGPQ